MNLAHLRLVAAVAKSGSFSAAAKACGVSQPTVSNAVADLEGELGAALFRRSPRGVTVTPFGRELIPQIDAVLASTSDLERVAAALRNPERKLLRLAFSPLIDLTALASMVEAFVADHPGVEVLYKECAIEDLAARMDRHQVDVIFAPRVVRRADWARAHIYSDRLRYLPQGGARGPQRIKVDLAEVARERLVLTQGLCGLAQTTRLLFADAGLGIDEYPGQAMSYAALAEWSELGLGAAVLPESKLGNAAHELALVAVHGKPALIGYDAMWSRSGTFSTHVRTFVRHLSRSSPVLFARSKGIWERKQGPTKPTRSTGNTLRLDGGPT